MGKKLLILFGILILSILSFGAETAEKGISSNTAVNVKAEVVNSLKITTSDVDFGIITPGETKNPPEKSGEIKIKGNPLGYVRIQIKDSVSKEYKDHLTLSGFKRTEYSVILTEQNTKAQMTSKLILDGAGVGSLLNGSYILNFSGEATFKVKGELTAGNNQAPGNYSGVLYVRTFYEYHE